MTSDPQDTPPDPFDEPAVDDTVEAEDTLDPDLADLDMPPPEAGAPTEHPKPRANGFMGVPLEVLICVGRARPLVSDVVRLRRDSVLELDTHIDDPVELFIGDRLIAKGELQEMDDGQGRLGVRLTEVADLSHEV
ncbi:MAG: FliM/FliN family flagellar motor switch protein [Pseudomonadota bacterium]